MRKAKLIITVLSLMTGMFLAMTVSAKEPRVSIIQTKTGDYQLLVEGKPYIVHGVCYSPIPIGQNYEYNWWGDPSKPWLNEDGPMMKEMGVNTIRIYQPGENPAEVK